jgi:hypothetical protein
LKLREKYGNITSVVPAADAKKLGLVKTKTKDEKEEDKKDGKDIKKVGVKDPKEEKKSGTITDNKKITANKEN